MNKLSGIYTITFPTGAIYVGKTNDFYRRVEEHRKKLESGTAAKAMQAEMSKLSGGHELEIELVVQCHEDHIDLMEDIYIRRAKAEYGSRCLNTQQRKDLGPHVTNILLSNIDELANSTADHLQLLSSRKLIINELQERIDLLENTEELPMQLAELELEQHALIEQYQNLYKDFIREKNKSWWTKLWE